MSTSAPRRAVAGVAVVLALVTAGCSSRPQPVSGPAVPAGAQVLARIGTARELGVTVPRPTPLAGAAGAAARADTALGLALLRRVGQGTASVSVSPASLSLALAMLQNGAGGTTRAQILQAMQAGGASSRRLDAGWDALTSAWQQAAADGGFVLQTANSIWQQQGLAVRPAFLAAMSRWFGTGVWQVDFAGHTGDALHAIDTWTSRHTHGRITKLFDHLDPRTALVLADAVYLHARWQVPFEASATRPGPFTTGAGTSVTARFMQRTGQLDSVRAAGYDAVQLPYAGGRFAALAIMPTRGTLGQYVDGLTPTSLAGVVAALHPQDVELDLPRITSASTLPLNDALQALGMRTAFTDAADFGALSPTPLKVGQALQRVVVQVGEKGTTAAAATGIAMMPTATMVPPPTLRFDHPFLFLVRDTVTGAVLFESAVQNPLG